MRDKRSRPDLIYYYMMEGDKDTMISTNDNVLRAWRDGLKARNSKSTLRTDGRYLWSYRLLIGIRKGGKTFLRDATPEIGYIPSVPF